MEPAIIRTADGSDTLFCRELNQHYHSTFGAVQESQHIYIETGFLYMMEKFQLKSGHGEKFIKILEIGFGTGLNALLTQAEAEKQGIRVHYTAVEPFPLDEHCWRALNYTHLPGSIDHPQTFADLHLSSWNKPAEISPHFLLHKIHGTMEAFSPESGVFGLIYFDAFSPDAQPELWTEQVFEKLGNALHPGGNLVTYSVKGTVVRALRKAGFKVEKLPGPPGKRHILRALKS